MIAWTGLSSLWKIRTGVLRVMVELSALRVRMTKQVSVRVKEQYSRLIAIHHQSSGS